MKSIIEIKESFCGICTVTSTRPGGFMFTNVLSFYSKSTQRLETEVYNTKMLSFSLEL